MKKVVVFITFVLFSFYCFSDVFDNVICGKWRISNVHFMINGSDEIVKDNKSYYEWMVEFRRDGSGYVQAKNETQVFRWSIKDGTIYLITSESKSIITVDEIEKNILIMIDKQKDRTNIAVLKRQK